MRGFPGEGIPARLRKIEERFGRDDLFRSILPERFYSKTELLREKFDFDLAGEEVKRWRGLEGKLQKLSDKAASSEEAYFLLKMGDLFRKTAKTNVPTEHRNHLILIQEEYLDFYEEARGSLKLFFDEVAKGIGS